MGIARFAFADLCEQPLGALDYLHIAHAYHTVMIDGIPVMARERRDAVRRFINLIDMLYDNGVCLIASADAEPMELCGDDAGAFAFARAASRLIEMRSEALWPATARHRRPQSQLVQLQPGRRQRLAGRRYPALVADAEQQLTRHLGQALGIRARLWRRGKARHTGPCHKRTAPLTSPGCSPGCPSS
jgi:hypothetical protein